MRNSRLGIIIEEVYKKNVFSWSFVMLLLSPILMVAVVAIISGVIGMATASDSIGTVSIIGATDQTVLESIQLSNRSKALGLTEEESSHLIDSNVAIQSQTVDLESGTSESDQDIQS
ncbi:MAG: ABC transporter permease, partial [Aerococcus viridans]